LGESKGILNEGKTREKDYASGYGRFKGNFRNTSLSNKKTGGGGRWAKVILQKS